jgi:hypothetical protein
VSDLPAMPKLGLTSPNPTTNFNEALMLVQHFNDLLENHVEGNAPAIMEARKASFFALVRLIAVRDAYEAAAVQHATSKSTPL